MAGRTRQPFCPATSEDSRSPCPALNALANHGYLPHDGRDISILQLVHAVQSVYNISAPLAWTLAAAGTVTCGRGLWLDLHDLARHNRIEHDASLTHADAQPGETFAPDEVDSTLLTEMLHSSPNDFLTFDDLANIRVRRDGTLHAPLDPVHGEIARGECALILKTFGDEEDRVPKELLSQFMGDEKIPEGWEGPRETVGLINTSAISRKLAKKVASLEAQR
ncbi:Cloroperoxidase [Rickenella mellea]|uniref:Cloroperoxidase n=1 Tax=Rickenella mellea TaxID=50990 RepID=A0A4Y7PMZ6_9AGAM|nr:Cloroperoxidase [Rickenella mellea]